MLSNLFGPAARPVSPKCSWSSLLRHRLRFVLTKTENSGHTILVSALGSPVCRAAGGGQPPARAGLQLGDERLVA